MAKISAAWHQKTNNGMATARSGDGAVHVQGVELRSRNALDREEGLKLGQNPCANQYPECSGHPLEPAGMVRRARDIGANGWALPKPVTGPQDWGGVGGVEK